MHRRAEAPSSVHKGSRFDYGPRSSGPCQCRTIERLEPEPQRQLLPWQAPEYHQSGDCFAPAGPLAFGAAVADRALPPPVRGPAAPWGRCLTGPRNRAAPCASPFRAAHHDAQQDGCRRQANPLGTPMARNWQRRPLLRAATSERARLPELVGLRKGPVGPSAPSTPLKRMDVIPRWIQMPVNLNPMRHPNDPRRHTWAPSLPRRHNMLQCAHYSLPIGARHATRYLHTSARATEPKQRETESRVNCGSIPALRVFRITERPNPQDTPQVHSGHFTIVPGSEQPPSPVERSSPCRNLQPLCQEATHGFVDHDASWTLPAGASPPLHSMSFGPSEAHTPTTDSCVQRTLTAPFPAAQPGQHWTDKRLRPAQLDL